MKKRKKEISVPPGWQSQKERPLPVSCWTPFLEGCRVARKQIQENENLVRLCVLVFVSLLLGVFWGAMLIPFQNGSTVGKPYSQSQSAYTAPHTRFASTEEEKEKLLLLVHQMPLLENAMEDFYHTHPLAQQEIVSFVERPGLLPVSLEEMFACKMQGDSCLKEQFLIKASCHNGAEMSRLYVVEGKFCKWQIYRNRTDDSFFYLATGVWDNTGHWEHFFVGLEEDADELGHSLYKDGWHVSGAK